MSASKLKRRLKEAQKIWQEENRNQDIDGLPGYTPGVLRGFKETLRIIGEMQREQVCKDITERRMVSRWNGVALYRACRQAYGRLKYSDRKGALRALQRALKQTRD
jgi:hypothetical protein